MTEARAALRAATDAAHRRLHEMAPFQALAEGRLDRAGYAALLRRTLGFHLALEARLEQAADLSPYGIALADRRRTPLLRDDLRFLGAPAETPVAPLPPFADAAEALGGLYVGEGSTLGGRELARALDALLPAGGEGRRFLLGHGERHGAMWRACCAALELCGREPGGLEGMIRGATATFADFEGWFGAIASPGVPPAPSRGRDARAA